MKALFFLVLLCGTAHADLESLSKWDGGAMLHYELGGEHAYDGDAQRFEDVVMAGVRLHGFASPKRHVGFHLGFDVAGGSTLSRAGFAYDCALYPLGIGLRAGRTQFLAIGAGIGGMGAVGTLDDAVTYPVEALAEFNLGGALRVLARARHVFGAIDEDDATFAIRIGHRYHEFDFPSGNGYFVGATYRELEGTRFYGVVLGYSIDLAALDRR